MFFLYDKTLPMIISNARGAFARQLIINKHFFSLKNAEQPLRLVEAK